MEQKFEELYKLRNKIKIYEARAYELKEEILQYMDEQNKDKISNKQFVVDRRQMKVERMSKSNCPEDVWKKYCKTSNYFVLNIKQQKSQV